MQAQAMAIGQRRIELSMKIAAIQGPARSTKEMSVRRGSRTALSNLRRGGKLSDGGRTGGGSSWGAGKTAREIIRSMGAVCLWKTNEAWSWPRGVCGGYLQSRAP